VCLVYAALFLVTHQWLLEDIEEEERNEQECSNYSGHVSTSHCKGYKQSAWFDDDAIDSIKKDTSSSTGKSDVIGNISTNGGSQVL
jgi:hypothetical protein